MTDMQTVVVSPRILAGLLYRLSALSPIAKAAARHEGEMARLLYRAFKDAQKQVSMEELTDVLSLGHPGTGSPLFVLQPTIDSLLEPTAFGALHEPFMRAAAGKKSVQSVLSATMKSGAAASEVCAVGGKLTEKEIDAQMEALELKADKLFDSGIYPGSAAYDKIQKQMLALDDLLVGFKPPKLPAGLKPTKFSSPKSSAKPAKPAKNTSKLSPIEQKTLRDYVEGGDSVNIGLRKGKIEKRFSGYIKALDGLMKPLPAAKTVTRYIPKDVLKDLKPGTRFTDRGFVSTTTLKNEWDIAALLEDIGLESAANVSKVVITAPKGTQAIEIAKTMRGMDLAASFRGPVEWSVEGEILFARDLTYKVTKVVVKGGQRTIHVTIEKAAKKAGSFDAGKVAEKVARRDVSSAAAGPRKNVTVAPKPRTLNPEWKEHISGTYADSQKLSKLVPWQGSIYKTSEVLSDITDYGRIGSSINKELRKGLRPKEIKALDAYQAKWGPKLKSGVDVYRGVVLRNVDADALTVGSAVLDKGYQSATTAYRLAEQFARGAGKGQQSVVFVIKSPGAAATGLTGQAEMLARANGGDEFIFKRSQKFKVISRRTVVVGGPVGSKFARSVLEITLRAVK